jgi:chloramphenicol 3-O-phosphotransferase
MSHLPQQLRDRSITIYHEGTPITWTPRDQLVPTGIHSLSHASYEPPRLLRVEHKKVEPLSIMHRLKQAFYFSRLTKEPTVTKVHLTGVSPKPTSPLLRQSSTWDMRTKIQCSHNAHSKNKKETNCRPASPNIYIPTALRKLACMSYQKREAKGEKVQCSNYHCRRCRDRKVSVVRGNQGLCQDCAGEVEGCDVILRTGKKKSEEKERGEIHDPNTLAGSSLIREIEAHRRAEEDIEASTNSTGSLCSSTAAVIVFGERKRDTGTERARFERGGNLRTRRKSKKLKLNLKKFCGGGGCGNCGDQGCGSVLIDGDGVSIRTSSDESLVLISVGQEPAYEAVFFNAAQIGSPTGLAYATWPCPPFRGSIRAGGDEEVKDGETSTWPSPHLRALVESGEASNLEGSEALLSKQPRLFLRKGQDLQLELAEAMNSPISPLVVTRGRAVRPNSSNQSFLSNATSNPIPIPARSSKHQDRMSELNIPTPAHLEMYHESPPTNHGMDPLGHSSPGSSLSLPRSLLLELSLDSSFSLPASLADSVFCKELVRTLSNIPEGMERVKDAATQTSALYSSPDCLYLENLPRSLRLIKYREALKSSLPGESRTSESSPATRSLPQLPIHLESRRRGQWVRPDSARPRNSSEFSSNSSPRSRSLISQAMASHPLSPDSEASEFLEYFSCEEYRAKLCQNLASTYLPTIASFTKLRSSPTPSPSPVSDRSLSSVWDSSLTPFLFEPTHFHEDRLLYPHPHPHRTPSPALTPYPSLSSSTTSLDYGFHPNLEGFGLSKKINPQGCTPPSRDDSQRLAEWSNEGVSLFGTTPKIVCVRGGEHGEGSREAVKVRGGCIQRTKRKWKVGKHVTKKIRKLKDRFEDWVATEKVKTELTEMWERRECHMGFAIVGIEVPMKMKARRRGKSDRLAKWRLGLAKDEGKGKGRA